jgi:hypothetical protein
VSPVKKFSKYAPPKTTLASDPMADNVSAFGKTKVMFDTPGDAKGKENSPMKKDGSKMTRASDKQTEEDIYAAKTV